MELRHLRYAVAVADSLHFGHAAERLHISQPPLSQQIRQLEDELGVRLFNRTKRHVQLTEAGRTFVREARLILAQAEHAAKLAQRASHGEIGQLIIGIAGPADTPAFVEVLRLCAERHPNIHLVVREMGTAQQAAALREGRLHAGFLVPPVDATILATEPFVRQAIVAALPRQHPLAARPCVPLQALAAEQHVLFARELDPRLYDAIISACREAGGFSPNVVHEVDNLHTACAMVAAGLGVGFVPAGLQDGRSRLVALKPIRPALPGVDCQLVLAYRRNADCELIRLFAGVVKEAAGGRRRRTAPNRRGPAVLMAQAG